MRLVPCGVWTVVCYYWVDKRTIRKYFVNTPGGKIRIKKGKPQRMRIIDGVNGFKNIDGKMNYNYNYCVE